MIYLDVSEYSTYGLEKMVPAAWIAAASALIESYCRRPTLSVAQYVERVRMRPDRNTVRVTYLPLAALAPATSPLVAVRGRYAVPRRGEERPVFDLERPIGDLALDVALAFGLPGIWSAIDPTAIDYFADTGELTLPSNPLGFGYNEVEITYTAGLSTIPDAVKFACAQIVRNAQATPALNVRAGSLERMELEYFGDTLLDPTVCANLAPYVALKMG